MNKDKQWRQYEKLVLTPVNKLIPKLAIPTVISMMITMIYNLADAFFVGKIGTSAAAAIGILMSVQAVFQAIGFMCGHGSGSIISGRLGQGDTEGANATGSTGFALSAIFSIAVMIPELIFIKPFMLLLGSTETILPYAVIYGYYIIISGPALSMSCVLNNVLRYEGRAALAMVGLVSGGVLNIIGDPILMFGLDMGIHGAGLSTAISQYVSLFLLLYMYLSGRTITKLSVKNISFSARNVFHILSNGLPSLCRQVLNSLSSMTLNICANPYGDAAIAAMTITGRVNMFVGSVMIGIMQGFQPVSAYNYGARKYKRVRDGFNFTSKAGQLVLTVLAIITFIFARPLITCFRAGPEVIEIGTMALRFQCLAMIMQPFGVVSNMTFQSIGKSATASFLGSLRSGLCYLPALLILQHFLGLTGIELAQPVADILTSVICIPFVVKFFMRLPKEDVITDLDRRYMGIQENSNDK